VVDWTVVGYSVVDWTVVGYPLVDWGVKLVGVSANGVVEKYKDVCASDGVIVTVPIKVDVNEELLIDKVGTLSFVG
jgi:hypothetical protein